MILTVPLSAADVLFCITSSSFSQQSSFFVELSFNMITLESNLSSHVDGLWALSLPLYSPQLH